MLRALNYSPKSIHRQATPVDLIGNSNEHPHEIFIVSRHVVIFNFLSALAGIAPLRGALAWPNLWLEDSSYGSDVSIQHHRGNDFSPSHSLSYSLSCVRTSKKRTCHSILFCKFSKYLSDSATEEGAPFPEGPISSTHKAPCRTKNGKKPLSVVIFHTKRFLRNTTLRHCVTFIFPLERNRKRPIRISPNRLQVLTFSGREE